MEDGKVKDPTSVGLDFVTVTIAIRPRSEASAGPHFLTLRPAAPLPGNYSFVTNRDSLRRLLRRTDLPSTILEKFETGIDGPKGASLRAFEPASIRHANWLLHRSVGRVHAVCFRDS
jgi:hypothetical protein